MTGCRICAPEMFTDAEARQIAGGLLLAADRLAPTDLSRLLAAVEAYDLAAARLLWVEECTCDASPEQRAALGWHAAAAESAHDALVRMLRRTALLPTG